MSSFRRIRFRFSLRLMAMVFAAIAMAWSGDAVCLAVDISDLYNTGVDDAGAPLVDDDLDTHYELILIDVADPDPDPVPPDDPVVHGDAGGFPTPPWLDNAADFDGDVPSDSRWIVPSADTNGLPGAYHFEARFDLTGFDHATANISGGWSTDNFGLDILVNGTSTGQTQMTQFVGWEPFTIPTTLLVPGQNSIVFIVDNAPPGANPAGLRVDFAVKDVLVPEPATMGILGLGLMGLALVRRSRTHR